MGGRRESVLEMRHHISWKSHPKGSSSCDHPSLSGRWEVAGIQSSPCEDRQSSQPGMLGASKGRSHLARWQVGGGDVTLTEIPVPHRSPKSCRFPGGNLAHFRTLFPNQWHMQQQETPLPRDEQRSEALLSRQSSSALFSCP